MIIHLSHGMKLVGWRISLCVISFFLYLGARPFIILFAILYKVVLWCLPTTVLMSYSQIRGNMLSKIFFYVKPWILYILIFLILFVITYRLHSLCFTGQSFIYFLLMRAWKQFTFFTRVNAFSSIRFWFLTAKRAKRSSRNWYPFDPHFKNLFNDYNPNRKDGIDPFTVAAVCARYSQRYQSQRNVVKDTPLPSAIFPLLPSQELYIPTYLGNKECITTFEIHVRNKLLYSPVDCPTTLRSYLFGHPWDIVRRDITPQALLEVSELRGIFVGILPPLGETGLYLWGCPNCGCLTFADRHIDLYILELLIDSFAV